MLTTRRTRRKNEEEKKKKKELKRAARLLWRRGQTKPKPDEGEKWLNLIEGRLDEALEKGKKEHGILRVKKGEYDGYFGIGPRCDDPTGGWRKNPTTDAVWSDDLHYTMKVNRIRAFLDHRYGKDDGNVGDDDDGNDVRTSTAAAPNSTRVTRSTRASAAAVAVDDNNEEEGNEEDGFPPLADDDSYEDEENDDEDQEHAGAAGGGSDGEDVEEERHSVDAGNGGQGDNSPSVVIVISDDDTDADAGLDALEAGLVGQEQEQQEVLAPSLLRTTRRSLIDLFDMVDNLKGKVAHLVATMRKIVKANSLGQKRLEQQIQDLTARVQALEEQAEEGT